MITKLLAFPGFMRAGSPSRVEDFGRARAKKSYFHAAKIRYVPRPHAPLECRWRVDPVTGVLQAVWMDPSANAGTRPSSESDVINARRRNARRRLDKFRRVTRGFAIMRLGGLPLEQEDSLKSGPSCSAFAVCRQTAGEVH